jgi:hypothetical protein
MSALKYLALTAVIVGTSAYAGPMEDVEELLGLWEPKKVQIDDGRLKVFLPQERVTEQMYLAILTAGLCVGPLVGQPLNVVREISVLNRSGTQGYVYEKGLEDCEDFNNRAAADRLTKFEILAATHLY